MKRVDEIMQELGFNKDAEFSVKKAFIKNLIKQAYGVNVDDSGFRSSSEDVVALPAQSNHGTSLTESLEVLQSEKQAPSFGKMPHAKSSMEGTRGDFLNPQLAFDFFEAI